MIYNASVVRSCPSINHQDSKSMNTQKDEPFPNLVKLSIKGTVSSLSELNVSSIDARLELNTVLIVDPETKQQWKDNKDWVENKDPPENTVYAILGSDGDVEPLECSICTGTLQIIRTNPSNDADTIIACKHGHAYHRVCLGGWVRSNNKTCPDCRALLDGNILDQFQSIQDQPAANRPVQPGAPVQNRQRDQVTQNATPRRLAFGASPHLIGVQGTNITREREEKSALAKLELMMENRTLANKIFEEWKEKDYSLALRRKELALKNCELSGKKMEVAMEGLTLRENEEKLHKEYDQLEHDEKEFAPPIIPRQLQLQDNLTAFSQLLQSTTNYDQKMTILKIINTDEQELADQLKYTYYPKNWII